MQKEKVIRLDSGTVTFGTDGIIYIDLKEDYEVELRDSKEIYKSISENCSGADNLILVRPGMGSTVTKEVREFTNRMPSVSRAEAILVDNLAHRLMANFISKFHNKKKKVKVFSSEERALEWLKQQGLSGSGKPKPSKSIHL